MKQFTSAVVGVALHRADMEFIAKARKAIVDMRAACRKREIDCPFDILVPSDALLESMPPAMVEQALVLGTWPGVDIRTGGDPGKVQEGTGAKGRVLIFHDRRAVLEVALSTITKATDKMNAGADPGGQ